MAKDQLPLSPAPALSFRSSLCHKYGEDGRMLSWQAWCRSQATELTFFAVGGSLADPSNKSGSGLDAVEWHATGTIKTT